MSESITSSRRTRLVVLSGAALLAAASFTTKVHAASFATDRATLTSRVAAARTNLQDRLAAGQLSPAKLQVTPCDWEDHTNFNNYQPDNA